MDEFSFIDSIKQHTYKQASVVKGIGDDAAVFRQSTEDIVTAVDTFVEGVHFSRKTMPAFYIGYRALAANLSDVAAMGASPAFYLVSIVIPSSWSPEEVKEIFVGMKELAFVHELDLIGGDTVSGAALTISITVIGFVGKDKARYRSAARAGDIVFVTGTLGDSRAGFHILTHTADYKHEAYFIKRHRMPSPRVDFALELRSLSRMALNDISDGIANEAAEIAEASGVSIVLEADKMPVSQALNQFPQSLREEWTYFGGEDFELMGTVTPEHWPKVLHAGERCHIPVVEAGYVSSQKPGKVFLYQDNNQNPLQKKGYTHLK